MTQTSPPNGTTSRPTNIILTAHARERMTEMRIDEPEIVDTIRDPELDRPNPNDQTRLATKGRLKVAYLPEHDQARIITVMWEGRNERAEGPLTHIPNKPSNRVFLDKLQLWGCTLGRKRSDYIQIRTPNGQLIQVRPAGYSRGNAPRTLIDTYRALGVTAEQFWARTEQIRPPRERIHTKPADLKYPSNPPEPDPDPVTPPKTATKPEPNIDSVSGRILAYYRGHPGETPNLDDVARDLGIDRRRIAQACYFLQKDGHIQRLATHRYRWLRWGEPDSEKTRAKQQLAYITDPANRLPPPAPRTDQPTQTGYTGQVLNHYRDHPGQTFTSTQVAAALGLPPKTVSNSLHRLISRGDLEKTGRYTYRYPTSSAPADRTPAVDPLARLDAIQARIDNNDQPAPTPEPEPVPPPAPTPAPAPTPEPVLEPAAISVEDRVDQLLTRLAPNGLKARHLDAAATWATATRHLLTTLQT